MGEAPILRRALPADAEAIRDLTRAAYQKWVPLIGREPLPMRSDPNEALRLHRIDLMEADGALLGLIETHLAEDHLWIENLCIRPGLQRQGLGARLLAHAEALARQEGRARVRLLTNPAFSGNVAFYENHGYAVERTEPFLGGFTTWLGKAL